ncbi:MAG: ParA family protein [Coriobacteriia bacterium]|nr:ParA family protein [Coriobacteriia bacterium]
MSVQVVAFVNHKGGVGKTTSVANIGAALGREGKRVLLVDLDPQAYLSSAVGIQVGEDAPSVYEVLTGVVAAEGATVAPSEFYDVLPSTLALSRLEVEFGAHAGRDLLLRRALELPREAYDWILIDCPPSLGMLMLNALAAATAYVVPVQTEYFALRGLGTLEEIIEQAHDYLNSALVPLGVLPTLYDGRKNQHSDTLAELKESYGELVLPSVRMNVALADAQKAGRDIFAFRANAHGAEDYAAVARELLVRAEGGA